MISTTFGTDKKTTTGKQKIYDQKKLIKERPETTYYVEQF